MQARAIIPILLLLVSGACESAPGNRGQPLPTASASGVGLGSTLSSGAGPARSAEPREIAANKWSGAWTGSFQAEKANVTAPKGQPKGAWAGDKGQLALGQAELELTISPDGLVEGTARGALGRLRVRGILEQDALRAGLSPEDPLAEPAMSGLLVGAPEGNQLAAEVRVSNEDGSVVRSAKVTLKRATAR